jgi:cysteine desulfurase
VSLYFDNASTTPLTEEAKEAMKMAFDDFGNPSSLHAFGRKAKSKIELTRRQLASSLKVQASEIFFTSGATESLNTAIRSACEGKQKKKVYSSHLEHHAVLDTLEHLRSENQIDLHFLSNDEFGKLDLSPLNESVPGDVLVLMGHNNEIGFRNPIEELSQIASELELVFICDLVQSIAIEDFDFQELSGIQSAVFSAHKFGGPKGIGILFWRSNRPLIPLIYGGAQERALRAGTENTIAIAGLSAAWRMLKEEKKENKRKLRVLSGHLVDLLSSLESIAFNGPAALDNHHPGIINVSIPYEGKTSMLLFQLDMKGLCVSEGSACTSGSSQGSHVIKALKPNQQGRANLRFSLSHNQSLDEIEQAFRILKEVLPLNS